MLPLKYPDTARIPSQKGEEKRDDDRRGARTKTSEHCERVARRSKSAGFYLPRDCFRVSVLESRDDGLSLHRVASPRPAHPLGSTVAYHTRPVPRPVALPAVGKLKEMTLPGTVHSLSIWKKSASELRIEVRSGEGIWPSGGGLILTHAVTEIVLVQSIGQQTLHRN
jgi:hypothetical protein